MKGWIEDGAPREAVLDVAGGDTGATVDLATCEPKGAGHASLCTVWTDPDSVNEGLASCCAEDHRATIRERAWTSPIWYTP